MDSSQNFIHLDKDQNTEFMMTEQRLKAASFEHQGCQLDLPAQRLQSMKSDHFMCGEQAPKTHQRGGNFECFEFP